MSNKRYIWSADTIFKVDNIRQEVFVVYDTKEKVNICECKTKKHMLLIALALNHLWERLQDEDKETYEMGGQ